MRIMSYKNQYPNTEIEESEMEDEDKYDEDE